MEKHIGLIKWFHDNVKNTNIGFIHHAILGDLFFHAWIQLTSAILVIMRLCAHFQQKTRHGVFGNSMFFLVGC
jgi:hypothetical protein